MSRDTKPSEEIEVEETKAGANFASVIDHGEAADDECNPCQLLGCDIEAAHAAILESVETTSWT